MDVSFFSLSSTQISKRGWSYVSPRYACYHVELRALPTKFRTESFRRSPSDVTGWQFALIHIIIIIIIIIIFVDAAASLSPLISHSLLFSVNNKNAGQSVGGFALMFDFSSATWYAVRLFVCSLANLFAFEMFLSEVNFCPNQLLNECRN